MRKVVALVGPTAVGKSRLALRLAQTFDGEIVSADSRQVYRYMDIGTAKPTWEERVLIPHHLIDLVNPDGDFSQALYQELAYEALEDIHKRNKIALLVGGSGLYIWGVVKGLKIPPVPPQPHLRQALQERARIEGTEALYRELEGVDPAAAERIDPRNVRRVIRALEVYQKTGVPFSQLQKRELPPFQTLVIGLTTDRADLYRRIDSRVNEMIESGWVEEVKSLVERGYGLELPSMSGVGYREIGMFLQGKLDLPRAAQEIKFQTHRFARHQYAWFRLKNPEIHWFDIDHQAEERVERLMGDFLAGEKVEVKSG